MRNNVFTSRTKKTSNNNIRNKLETIFFIRNKYRKRQLKNNSNKLFKNNKKLFLNSFSIVNISIAINFFLKILQKKKKFNIS